MRLLPALLLAATAGAAEPALRPVLDESFDGDVLDPKVWTIETGRRRDSLNSPKAVDLKDGVLRITTWTDADGTTYCGFVTTRKKLTVTQGRLEARCRFSVQPGTQIAFWSQSPTYGRSGAAAGAATDGVEIDILETTGLKKGGYQSVLHWGPYKHATEKKASSVQHPAPVGGEWHDYGVEWDDAGYRFSFDGKVVWTDAKCPGSKAPQFLLLTSESNLKGWNGERPKEGYGLKDASRNTFEVDRVRAWTR
ncbi:MAG: glycoside hydrolase family 16 protein [Verrucomicrobia bacterium]|nr:glycoside hydrolase family 16 protein [Verrucomicrobiota bacterium]